MQRHTYLKGTAEILGIGSSQVFITEEMLIYYQSCDTAKITPTTAEKYYEATIRRYLELAVRKYLFIAKEMPINYQSNDTAKIASTIERRIL